MFVGQEQCAVVIHVFHWAQIQIVDFVVMQYQKEKYVVILKIMVLIIQFYLNIGVQEILVGLIIIIVALVEMCVLHHLNVKMVCVLKQ